MWLITTVTLWYTGNQESKRVSKYNIAAIFHCSSTEPVQRDHRKFVHFSSVWTDLLKASTSLPGKPPHIWPFCNFGLNFYHLGQRGCSNAPSLGHIKQSDAPTSGNVWIKNYSVDLGKNSPAPPALSRAVLWEVTGYHRQVTNLCLWLEKHTFFIFSAGCPGFHG